MLGRLHIDRGMLKISLKAVMKSSGSKIELLRSARGYVQL